MSLLRLPGFWKKSLNPKLGIQGPSAAGPITQGWATCSQINFAPLPKENTRMFPPQWA